MRYRILGNSGLRVSELCLGTMTFGDDWGWGAPPAECAAMLDVFLENGGNFVDTASNYTDGSSERILGELLQGRRDEVVLATKYTMTSRPGDPNGGGNHRKNLVQSLEQSLRRLRTDRVDLLWLHIWDGTTPVEEVLRALDDMVRAGKVLHAGMSDTPSWVVARACAIAELRGWTRPCAVQAPYSLSSRDVERELLPMAQAHNLPVLAWAVIGGGVITGKYTATDGGPRRYGDLTPRERTRRIVAEVQAVAGECGMTPAQVALAWMRAPQRRPHVIPLLGARTAAQLRENLRVVDLDLPAEAVERLDGVGAIEHGFPRDFLADEEMVGLVFGSTRRLLEV
ncbi:MAG TPA: aldo/keto reductase [Candidatus Angelobacter sp.]|jgi:aryl-alcohol dehydrogenase-like predicted oxidoreductase|nr:aldo/keto reductase [Candidatus Angelobacter sp.]